MGGAKRDELTFEAGVCVQVCAQAAGPVEPLLALRTDVPPLGVLVVAVGRVAVAALRARAVRWGPLRVLRARRVHGRVPARHLVPPWRGGEERVWV